MSTAPERTAEQVTGDLVLLACAGINTRDLRESTARRVRELADEMCNLVQDATRAQGRRSLGRAWGAWLDLMMSVHLPEAGGKSLLQDVLDLEPGLRERFEAEFLGKRRE